MRVDEVLGTTATATVDVSFVDNTGTPRFVIVWNLVKEGGRWKLDSQLSAQREMKPQPDSSPTPSDADMSHVRTENESPGQLAKGNQSGIYHGVDSLLRRDHLEEGFTSAADAQETSDRAPER